MEETSSSECDSVTALNEGSFPRVSGVGCKPTAELGDELICLLTYRPHGFERHRYTKMHVLVNPSYFVRFLRPRIPPLNPVAMCMLSVEYMWRQACLPLSHPKPGCGAYSKKYEFSHLGVSDLCKFLRVP